MRPITKVTILDGYKLELTFDNGESGIVDLSRHVGCGVFAAWNDPEVFRSIRIGSSGELAWGEEIDFCPDALYLEATGKRLEEAFPALSQVDAVDERRQDAFSVRRRGQLPERHWSMRSMNCPNR